MAGSAWAPEEWRANWRVLPPSLAGVMLCAVHGYSLGVMVSPLEHEFGWSRAAITAGPFIISLFALWAAPLTGFAVDRFGPRRIALLGVAVFCGTLALLSTATSVLTWWLLWALLGLGNMLVLPTVWTAAIASRFERNRGMALACALCGTGLTAAIVPMLTDTLMTQQGWRHAYVSLAAICFVVVFPLVLLSFRGARELRGAVPVVRRKASGELRAAFTSRAFVLMICALVSYSVALCALTTNGVPVLIGRGFGHAEAAQIAGLLGLGSVTGRLGCGYLLDRFDAKKIAALGVIAPIAAALLLLAVPGSGVSARIAFLMIGLAAGSEYDASAYLASRHFGVHNFGTVFGAIGGVTLLANGLAPLIANYIYDMTKSYDTVLWAQLPLGLAAAAFFLLLGPYPAFAPEEIEADEAFALAHGAPIAG
jgi:MFS family permease